MTAQLPELPSKERLEELAVGQSGFNLRMASHDESMQMARALLAGMEQEPVAWMVDGWVSNDKKWAERRSVEDNLLLEPLYCHPIITGIDENHYNPELEPGIYVAEIMTKGGAAIINGYYAEQPVPVVSEHTPLVSEVTPVVSEQAPVKPMSVVLCVTGDDGKVTEYQVQPAPVAVPDVLKDLEALEGCREWLLSHDQTVNVGQVEGQHDTLIESSAGYLVRVVDACRAAMLNHSGDSDDMVLIPPNSREYQSEHVLAMLNSPVIPDGWKLVPIEPTKDMLHAGQSVVGFWLNTVYCYSKMLAAAPQPPAITSGWIKCSDRMPEIMKTVIVAEGEYISYTWWNGEAWDCWDDHGELQDVTHWMPLPAAPKPEGE